MLPPARIHEFRHTPNCRSARAEPVPHRELKELLVQPRPQLAQADLAIQHHRDKEPAFYSKSVAIPNVQSHVRSPRIQEPTHCRGCSHEWTFRRCKTLRPGGKKQVTRWRSRWCRSRERSNATCSRGSSRRPRPRSPGIARASSRERALRSY